MHTLKGLAMMDFFVRETRAVTTGKLVIVRLFFLVHHSLYKQIISNSFIRLGTCGGLSSDAVPGSIVLASHGSALITRNPDAFTASSLKHEEPYRIHQIAAADSILSDFVETQLLEVIDESRLVKGLNITADSFYSSQGRVDKNFRDDNEDIIDKIITMYPDVKSMEMETFQLFHLANSCKEPIAATAAAIVVANRKSNQVIDALTLERLEEDGGLAILKSITLI